MMTKTTHVSLLLATLLCYQLHGSHALSSLKQPTRTRSRTLNADERLLSELRPTKTSQATTKTRYPKQYQNTWLDDEEDDDDFALEESVTKGFQELQQSTGSEILDSRLQGQLDGISHPNQFLDRHVQDATPMEKIAMSSITQQLPQAAVDALSTKAGTTKENKKPKKTLAQKSTTINNSNSNSNNVNRRKSSLPPALQYSGHRVTPEQEIELAQIIQKGAALEAVKEKAETKEKRMISRQEWADLAGLSNKELRREIATYRKAKHLLVTANVGLVGAVVNQQWSNNKDRYLGITKEELIQEGSLGLLRAAELFDPSRGLRFSTYAVVWIKGVLSNSHVQELVRLPDREKRRWRKIQQAQSDLEAEHDGSFTLEQLCEATDMTLSDILFTQRKMKQAQSLLSLDYEQKTQSRSGTESTSMSTIHNDRAMREDDILEQMQLQSDLVAALARNLDAREARLMRLRYGLSDGVTRSLHECADAMGLSYTRVQQLSKMCLKKLREAADAESLQEYLLTIA